MGAACCRYVRHLCVAVGCGLDPRSADAPGIRKKSPSPLGSDLDVGHRGGPPIRRAWLRRQPATRLSPSRNPFVSSCGDRPARGSCVGAAPAIR